MRYNNVKFENGLDGHIQMWEESMITTILSSKTLA